MVTSGRHVFMGLPRDPAASRICVVEFVGPAGVGKSSVIPLVAAQLRTRHPASGVRVISPQRHDSEVSRRDRLRALALHPRACLAVGRIVWAASGSRRWTLRRWVAAVGSEVAARRARADTITIVEQGVVQILRRPSDLDRLPDGALPDLVVEIDSHPSVVLRRRLDRDKPPGPREILRGADRARQVQRLAWRLADLDEPEARSLVEEWAARFCSPPLRAGAFDRTFALGRDQPEPEDPLRRWSSRVIREAIQERVKWTMVDNGVDTTLEELASDAVARIENHVSGSTTAAG